MAILDFPRLSDAFIARIDRDYVIGEEEAEQINAIIETWGNEDCEPGSTVASSMADLEGRVLAYLNGGTTE